MASSSSRNYSYDVFLSYHGPDVRKTLLSHIRKQFRSKAITMFDDHEMRRGTEISPELIQAIRNSRISIVVFSNNYASSSWCLDELAEILEHKKTMGQPVMALYYGVDPLDVRKQSGEFGKAFDETCAGKTEDEIQKWRKALIEASNIDGEDSSYWDNEAIMIEKIANDILDKLNVTPSRDFDDMARLKAQSRGIQALYNSYDVFCNFYGSDVSKTLLSHMRKQFESMAITMFDDHEMRRGTEIVPERIQAIRESRISTVILSKNYASSSWCLDELVEILELKKTMGQPVMTLYYGVDPLDVRKQSREFGKAFDKTCAGKTEDKIQKWRKALDEVSEIDGEDSLFWVSEADMMEKFAKDVVHELNATQSTDSDDSETKPLLGSDNDGIEMGEISGHSGIDPSDVRTGNLGVLLGETSSSTTEEDFLSGSSQVEEMCVVNIPPEPDDNENQPASQKPRASRTKVKIEWSLLIIFFILEIPSCVLDQISSTDRPSYALAAMLLSLLACLVGLIDILYKGITEKVVWKWCCPIPWFYYPTELSNMFGSFPEMVGLLCGVCQTILTTINSSFIIRKVDAPIKVSVWPLIFALGALFNLYVKENNKRILDDMERRHEID